VLLGTRLTWHKWGCLLLLFVGLSIMYAGETKILPLELIPLISITTQALSSVCAGIFSEYYLKKDMSFPLPLQNAYLHAISIVMNLIFLSIVQPQSLTISAFAAHLQTCTIPVIIFGSLGGFTTSLLIKYISVIWKEFANAGEIMLTALLASLLFGASLKGTFWISLVLVVCSTYWYHKDDFH
jgi:drug/metabolite transporter (DMT)-like permease